MAGALLPTLQWLTVCGNERMIQHNPASILGDPDIFQTIKRERQHIWCHYVAAVPGTRKEATIRMSQDLSSGWWGRASNLGTVSGGVQVHQNFAKSWPQK